MGRTVAAEIVEATNKEPLQKPKNDTMFSTVVRKPVQHHDPFNLKMGGDPPIKLEKQLLETHIPITNESTEKVKRVLMNI